MGHGWLLATRSWRARPIRTASITAAVALAVATVVWVTSSYESVRQGLEAQVADRWVGRSHLCVESPLGHWGKIPEEVVDVVRAAPGVTDVTPRLVRRALLSAAFPGTPDLGAAERRTGGLYVDGIGIDPAREYRFRPLRVEGRLLADQDHGVTILEAETAERLGVSLGEAVLLGGSAEGRSEPFKVIGLFRAHRVAKFQYPQVYVPLADLQRLFNEIGSVTAVDAVVEPATPPNIESVAERLRQAGRASGQGYAVVTSSSRLQVMADAQNLTEASLTPMAGVSMLAAFFIVVTTMSMGLTERIRQLGVLRCLGTTRLQLAGQVVLEAAPPGMAGVVLGVPLGLGLVHVSTWFVGDYIGQWAINTRGIVQAVVCGTLTSLGAAMFPAVRAARLSPLAASRPRTAPQRDTGVLVAAVVGVLCLVLHEWQVQRLPIMRWLTFSVAMVGVTTLFLGYGLIMPLVVRLLGRPAAWTMAKLLRLHPVLVNDQLGKAAWRGAGVCCGLMVGLALLVDMVMQFASLRAGWDFPRQLPEAFVWVRERVPRDVAAAVPSLPGVTGCAMVNDFLCQVGQTKSVFFNLLKVRHTFVAGDPKVFFGMMKLNFVEGTLDEARRKLDAGGAILLPIESSRVLGLHLGDVVPITVGDVTAPFEIAGVVQSPALDIAVAYFQADSYMAVAASGAVLGTLDDVKRCFGLDNISLFLLDFSLPDIDVPAVFQEPAAPALTGAGMRRELARWGDRLLHEREELEALGGPGEHAVALEPYAGAMEYVATRWNEGNPEQRWDLFRDQLLVRRVVRTIGRPEAIYGSIRELKQRLDDDIGEATVLLSAIPAVAILIAGFGVCNLMTANLLTRTREIGVVRACGGTRGQIARLVFAEGLVLGTIGSLGGLLLGLHAAHSSATLLERLLGLHLPPTIPGAWLGGGIAFTMLVCVLSSLPPALRAARSNIIEGSRAVA